MPVSHLKRTCSRGKYLHLSGDNPLAISHSERLVAHNYSFDMTQDRQFHRHNLGGVLPSSRLEGLPRFFLPTPARPPVWQCLTSGALDGTLSPIFWPFLVECSCPLPAGPIPARFTSLLTHELVHFEMSAVIFNKGGLYRQWTLLLCANTLKITRLLHAPNLT